MAKELKSDLIRVVNQLMSKSGGEICKSLSPESESLRTWLCVYRNPPSYPRFTIRKFSVPANIDFLELDVSDSVMTNVEEMNAGSIDEIMTLLRNFYGEDLCDFQSPWAINCPF